MDEAFEYNLTVRTLYKDMARLPGETATSFRHRVTAAARQLERDFYGGTEARERAQKQREREQAQPVQRVKSVHDELRDSKQAKLNRAKEKYTR